MIHQRITSTSTRFHNAFVHSPYKLGDPRQIIEELRVKRGFGSTRALAIAAGIKQPTLSRYMSGKTETMDVPQFMAIAAVLEVTLSELLGEVPLSSRGEIRQLVKIMADLKEPERKALLAAGEAMVAATAKRQ